MVPPPHRKSQIDLFVTSHFLKGKKVKEKKLSPTQLSIQQYAANPPATLPKTDNQRIKELKELMIRSGGKDVAEKVIQIALTDNHPGQMAAIKMCMDRALPISMFEKTSSQRSAVTINITGLGQAAPDIIDVVQEVDINGKDEEDGGNG